MDERQQFASDLQLMKNRAMSLGLYATGQRLDYPIRMVGFEIGGNINACLVYEADLAGCSEPEPKPGEREMTQDELNARYYE